MEPPFFNASARSVSKSNVIESQLGSCRPTKRGMSVNSGFSGAPGVGMRQPDSKPGDRPGYTIAPLFVVAGAHALLRVRNLLRGQTAR